jgi:hypothetical protein
MIWTRDLWYNQLQNKFSVYLYVFKVSCPGALPSLSIELLDAICTSFATFTNSTEISKPLGPIHTITLPDENREISIWKVEGCRIKAKVENIQAQNVQMLKIKNRQCSIFFYYGSGQAIVMLKLLGLY